MFPLFVEGMELLLVLEVDAGVGVGERVGDGIAAGVGAGVEVNRKGLVMALGSGWSWCGR
jgi:hypothetical protein